MLLCAPIVSVGGQRGVGAGGLGCCKLGGSGGLCVCVSPPQPCTLGLGARAPTGGGGGGHLPTLYLSLVAPGLPGVPEWGAWGVTGGNPEHIPPAPPEQGPGAGERSRRPDPAPVPPAPGGGPRHAWGFPCAWP